MDENRIALEEWQKPSVEGRGTERLLSDVEVRDILLDPRTMREIAEAYGISRALVARIKDRTASYFQNRGFERGSWEPNPDLTTLPVIVAAVGRPTKLDEDDVQKILDDPRTLRDIAEDMGISVSTVWRVKNRTYQGRSKDFKKPPQIIAKVGGKLLMKEEA